MRSDVIVRLLWAEKRRFVCSNVTVQKSLIITLVYVTLEICLALQQEDLYKMLGNLGSLMTSFPGFISIQMEILL